jgi:hypothetical protein
MKDLIKTEKEFKEFAPTLKDMLCRLYNYIERWSKERSYISFTEQGLYMATSAIEITGRCSEKYANIFLANLDQIKTLAEAQPNTKVEITLYVPEGVIALDKDRNRKSGTDDYYFTSYFDSFKTYSIDRYATNMRNFRGVKYFHSDSIHEDGREQIQALTEQVK